MIIEESEDAKGLREAGEKLLEGESNPGVFL